MAAAPAISNPTAPVQSVAAPGGTLTYSGNPDFRGYVAANAPDYLSFIGNAPNSGSTFALGNGINTAALDTFLANNGGSGFGGNDTGPNAQDIIGQINSLYNAYNGLTTTPAGGGGGGGGNINGQQYYGNILAELQGQLGQLQGQQPTIISNIENAGNDAKNQLNQNESAAETGYNTQHAQDSQSRSQNIGQVNQNARSTFDSLMALLGAGGAGVSSAAAFGAPQAVAQNASSGRAGANQTFNSNESAINTAEGQTKQQYKNALTDLINSISTQKGTALSTLLNEEAGINQQITQAQLDGSQYAGMSFTPAEQNAPVQAVNDIEKQLGSIFQQYATPSFSVQPVTAAQPNLLGYTLDPTTIKTAAANPGTDSSFLPYLASLKQETSPTGILVGNQQQQTTPITVGATG